MFLCRKSVTLWKVVNLFLFSQLWILLKTTSCTQTQVEEHLCGYVSAGANYIKLQEHKTVHCKLLKSKKIGEKKQGPTMKISIHFTILFFWVTQGQTRTCKEKSCCEIMFWLFFSLKVKSLVLSLQILWVLLRKKHMLTTCT